MLNILNSYTWEERISIHIQETIRIQSLQIYPENQSHWVNALKALVIGMNKVNGNGISVKSIEMF